MSILDSKEISFKNITNFLKRQFKETYSLEGIIFDLDDVRPGYIVIKFSGYFENRKKAVINKNSFVVIAENGEEKDYSKEWKEYFNNKKQIDEQMYYQYEASKFG
ncbi:MAG: hypothetical protein IJ415_03815 [Clostridia bacterium]|nr:hypothetical protein [Clostridia bacterium]